MLLIKSLSSSSVNQWSLYSVYILDLEQITEWIDNFT